MKKKVLLSFLPVLIVTAVFAQQTSDDENDGGMHQFRKENIFIGGGINLGFAANTFQAGVSPELGYTIAPWLDFGLGLNLNYLSERADPYYNGNIRYHNLTYGGGPFVRIYPVRFLFVQGQFEANWIKVNAKDYSSGESSSNTYGSKSLIAGIGYTQRIVGQSSFYTMIGMDLLTDINSPYRDYNGAAIPIVRAGFNFYLRPSHRK